MQSRQQISYVHEHLSCEILVTNSCNMNCSYCIAKKLPNVTMTYEIGQKAIDMFTYLAEGGKTIEITFTGGEPLLDFNLLKQLTKYADMHVREFHMVPHFVIKTNGTILNQEIISFMKNYTFRVVVSIDGTCEVHDRHRKTLNGEKTHAVICQNIRKLLNNNILCVASQTIHPDSSTQVLKGIRYLYSIGITNIDIGPAYGTVSWTGIDTNNLGKSLLEVADYMHEVNLNGLKLEVGPIYLESEHIGGSLCDIWGCHAASTNLAFLPNGQMTGCSALAMEIEKYPSLILGDVFNGLKQIEINNLLEIAQAGRKKRQVCNKCNTSSNCTGGCLAINYATNGEALIPPAIYCNTIAAIPEAWGRAWGTITSV